MKQSVCVFVLMVGSLTNACGGGSGGGSSASPTSPTAITPAGCSGSPVQQVQVSFNSSDGSGMVIQLFGETFNQPTLALNQSFVVTRAVVPCSYELTGQMLGNRFFTIYFGRTSPFSNAEQGVERGSIVIDEGPGGTFGPNGCSVVFRAPLSPDGGLTPPGPFNIKLRFRVSKTNSIGNGGCG